MESQNTDNGWTVVVNKKQQQKTKNISETKTTIQETKNIIKKNGKIQTFWRYKL